MSHVPEVPHPPSSLSFGTVEALESWLQNPEPRAPDPRLCIATLVVARKALQVVLDHARRLPAGRELYIALPDLAKPERSLPEVPPKTSPSQAVASTERRSTIPDVHRSGDKADSLSYDTADTALLRNVAYDCKQGIDVVSISLSPDSSAPPSTTLNGAVTILYCSTHSAQANGGENISSPRGGDSGSLDGGLYDICLSLDIVHGYLDDIVGVCGRRQGRIRDLLVRLPPGALAEALSRERLELVLVALDPVKIIVEWDGGDDGEYQGFLTVFGNIKNIVRCKEFVFLHSVWLVERRSSGKRGTRGRNRVLK